MTGGRTIEVPEDELRALVLLARSLESLERVSALQVGRRPSKESPVVEKWARKLDVVDRRKIGG